MYINSTMLHLLPLLHEQMEKVTKRTNNSLRFNYNTQTSMKEIHMYIQLYLRCLSDEGDHESVVEATVISTTVKGPDTCTMNAYMYTCTCTCTYTCSSTCTCLEKDEDQYVIIRSGNRTYRTINSRSVYIMCISDYEYE